MGAKRAAVRARPNAATARSIDRLTAAANPGSLGSEPLPGAPAVVLLGGSSWPPNRDAARWFVRRVWLAVLERSPAATLHCFGGPVASDETSIRSHPAPADSARAFPAGAILAVPLRIASGVRMKILEAWARGVPVVATPQAAGLGVEDGRQLLVAEDARGFAAACARLAAEPDLAPRLTEEGRGLLAAAHRPESVAEKLLAVYRRAASPV